MKGLWVRALAIVSVLFALLALCRVLDPREVAGIALGALTIGATAWLPDHFVRLSGAALIGGVVFVLCRLSWQSAPTALFCMALGALCWWKLPVRVLRRVTFMVPSLVFLIFVTTLLMYHAPGNPFAQEKIASPQVEAALRAQYGVPSSSLEFFGIYIKRLLFESSFGPSIKVQGRTVEQLLRPAFPVSMSLGILALAIAVAVGLTLGVRAGLKPNSSTDYASMGLALLGISLPNFVIGAGLIMVFALELRLLPVSGFGSYSHLILPAITLALPYAAYIARLARNGTIEIMQQDFIRTARAKGLPERVVVLRHALRGAILPVVSFLGPAAAGILTGSFVVETLFGVPGMGQWFVKGAINRDYSVVLGTAIIYSALVTGFNLAVDLCYAWIDPRARGQL